jgi:tRNA (guanine37-N1)-methyltransferase
MSPQGKVLTQSKAKELSRLDRLVIICGHYEGIDERIIDEIVDEEISVGDYVLTGGELPACILVDCVSRLVEGVLPSSECHEIESISCGMLEFPQYTRPVEFNGRAVPAVLREGNHKDIEKWRYAQAIERTAKKRPDLI